MGWREKVYVSTCSCSYVLKLTEVYSRGPGPLARLNLSWNGIKERDIVGLTYVTVLCLFQGLVWWVPKASKEVRETEKEEKPL